MNDCDLDGIDAEDAVTLFPEKFEQQISISKDAMNTFINDTSVLSRIKKLLRLGHDKNESRIGK